MICSNKITEELLLNIWYVLDSMTPKTIDETHIVLYNPIKGLLLLFLFYRQENRSSEMQLISVRARILIQICLKTKQNKKTIGEFNMVN